MFGALRLFLAILVVYTHIGPPHGSSLGKHAVFGFYVLSGYLMTRVLNDVYRFRAGPFALNRFLRLYPMYLVVALLSVPAVLWLPSPGEFNNRYYMPEGVWPWLQSFLLLPTVNMPPFRLVPVSWSIAVELVNYAILWAFTARSSRGAWVAFVISTAVHIAAFAVTADHNVRYFPWYAAMLPFSIGALIYFHGEQAVTWFAKALGRSWRIVIGIIWAAVLALTFHLGAIDRLAPEVVSYVGIATMAALVIALGGLRSGGLDKALGELAYPVFLTHYLVAIVAHKLLLNGLPRGLILFSVSLFLMLVLSQILVTFQTRFIDPIRDRIRNSEPKSNASPVPIGFAN
ncbi:acyltransferase [Mesorhizobium sp. BH1-1-5]|uniref:acyltransferase family protein n=1 Tax=Mesorhizobium sp. BH1-1-5 TaxID=2876661 RepID=UPI001CCFFA4C|nr:acyltransferase [Mesorhizobium sp. BH1-1-5]MBZ9985656.1 acyltransferase [Mesorhizobium sp. BH1-1-5]